MFVFSKNVADWTHGRPATSSILPVSRVFRVPGPACAVAGDAEGATEAGLPARKAVRLERSLWQRVLVGGRFIALSIARFRRVQWAVTDPRGRRSSNTSQPPRARRNGGKGVRVSLRLCLLTEAAFALLRCALGQLAAGLERRSAEPKTSPRGTNATRRIRGRQLGCAKLHSKSRNGN